MLLLLICRRFVCHVSICSSFVYIVGTLLKYGLISEYILHLVTTELVCLTSIFDNGAQLKRTCFLHLRVSGNLTRIITSCAQCFIKNGHIFEISQLFCVYSIYITTQLNFYKQVSVAVFQLPDGLMDHGRGFFVQFFI